MKTNKDFTGNTVVITGSSRGIGKAIAISYAKHNANVVINYNKNKSAALETYNLIKKFNKNVILVKANVTKRLEIRNLFKKTIKTFKRIDILINNAGINKRSFFEDITEKDWDLILNYNLKSVFLCCQEVFPLMKKNGGKIINISSAASLYHGPKTVHYAVSKAGVNSLTKVLARYGAPHKILINAIAPGIILTDQTRSEINSSNGDVYLNMTLLKSYGEQSDISNACLYLSSSDQNYITGEILNISGGAYL